MPLMTMAEAKEIMRRLGPEELKFAVSISAPLYWEDSRRLDGRFVRIDGVARQGSDAQQCLRTARSGACRERPSRAKREFAICCNRWRTSQEFVEGARRLKTIK
jgi:hypothetical protein